MAFKQKVGIEYNSNIIKNRANILDKIYNILSDKLNDLDLIRHYELPIVDENNLTVRVSLENK